MSKAEKFKEDLKRVFERHNVTFKTIDDYIEDKYAGESAYFVVDGEPDYSASITEMIADWLEPSISD